MNSDRRLEWVQTNRLKKDRVQHVGTRMERLVEQLTVWNRTTIQEVSPVIAGLVDSEFRAHCRIAVADGGKLTINVDHPALVYSMRTRWLSLLREALSTMRSRRRIDGIVFEFGAAGVRLP